MHDSWQKKNTSLNENISHNQPATMNLLKQQKSKYLKNTD